jgi:CHAT domain-containing protein
MKRGKTLWATLAIAALLCATSAAGQDGEQGDGDDPLDALYTKTMTAVMHGDIATARKFAREEAALALKLHGPDSAEYKQAQSVLGIVAAMAGDASGAAKLIGAPLSTEDRDAHPLTQGNLLGRVASLRGQGRANEAIALLREVEPRLKTDEDKSGYYSQMGDLLAQTGDFTGSAEAYRKAAELFASAPDPNVWGVLEMRGHEALSLQKSGRKSEANALFDDIFARAEAEHARMLKQYGTFLPPDVLAQQMRTLAPASGILAADFEAAGRAAQVTGWRQGQFRSQDALMEASPYKAFNGLDLVYNLIGQPGREAEALEQARAVVGRARSLGVAGHGSGNGRWRKIPQDTTSSLFLALADADYGLARVRPVNLKIAREEALGALQEASSGAASRALLSSIADRQAGPEALERRGLSGQWSQLESQINAAFAAGRGADADVLVKDQMEVDARIATFDRQIAKQSPDYYGIVDPAPMSQADVQAMLRPDEALLLIISGERDTQVMAITGQDVAWYEAPLNEPALGAVVAGLRRSLDPRFRPKDPAAGWAFDRKAAYRLYQELLAPVAPTLAGKKQLFIVTAGPLSNLPLSVLVTQAPTGSDADPAALRGTAWFSDAYALSQLPSIQALKTLRRRAAPHAPRRAMLGFGDPLLQGKAALRGGSDDVRGVALETLLSPPPGDGTSNLANVELLRRMARLPGTATELNQLHDLLSADGAHVYLQGEATEAMVKHSDLSNLRVLAFATHALPSGAVGLDDPGLVLTPPQNPNARDDGLLTASEIVGLNLGVDWAILSACDTEDVKDGTVMAGLSQAFLAGGAETLLVSHWPVFDAVAGELTTGTFRALRADPGATRASALQSAMRQIRSQPDHPEFAHPAYWAPFVLIGDGARR